MSLQSQLLEIDHNKLQGFVEIGFSSATPNKKVALQYAGLNLELQNSCEHDTLHEWKPCCEAHRSTLLEIETGQVDRGCHSFISLELTRLDYARLSRTHRCKDYKKLTSAFGFTLHIQTLDMCLSLMVIEK